MTGQLAIFAVGIIGQLLFGARMIVQWFQSEKAGRSLSPVLFWQLSVLGAIVFFVYGVLRHDLAIVLGQLIVYFIYIRNLHLKQQWFTIAPWFRAVVYLVPVLSVAYLFSGAPGNAADLVGADHIPTWLKIWGAAGQIVFTLRFVVQWLDSESRKESVFSPAFWIVSLVGSTMIMSYAVLRRDPVLFFGQLGGAVVYVRNLALWRRRAPASERAGATPAAGAAAPEPRSTAVRR
ncbi:MAG TPA: lipid-A-disaccharide synthase N-terminal domain-containing protein [Anaeromyxobacteraceae bacterium]|nr:lipid-A-disaccharide synthase N-terminal domain-containing protein [Anaeromyxobacteraceae bacterium]